MWPKTPALRVLIGAVCIAGVGGGLCVWRTSRRALDHPADSVLHRESMCAACFLSAILVPSTLCLLLVVLGIALLEALTHT